MHNKKQILVIVLSIAVLVGAGFYMVDHRAPSSTDVTDPTLGVVGIGKTVDINDVRITLHEVVQDNRCPIDVQCIEAGAITANVTLQSGTDKETRNMASDEVPLTFGAYKISIEQIDPPRYAQKETDPDEYLLTFRVVHN